MNTQEIIEQLNQLTNTEQGYQQLEIISNYVTRLLSKKGELESLKHAALTDVQDVQTGDYLGQDMEIIKHIRDIYRLINAPFECFDCMEIWQSNTIIERFEYWLEMNFTRSAFTDDEIQLERWSFEAYEQYKRLYKNE